MNQKGTTPDEQFLIRLYKMAMEGGDPFQPIDVRSVAKAIGQKETAIKNIIKHLAQANFIKKGGDSIVSLTQNGCNFVLDEMENDSCK